ncbi:MAG: DUF167 family protein [Patescibacteria group bacterium]
MYIKVKVIAGAKKEKIEKKSEDHYEIWVKEKAENNRANERILEIFRHLYIDMIIRIVSGHHSPSKILVLDPKSSH